MPLKLEKSDEARKVIENLDDYLKKHRNANGIPLAYLTRDDVEAPDIADDPGYATPSFDEEMIRRASHVGTSYNIDNKALWGIIFQIRHGGPAWNWVKTSIPRL